MYKEKSGLCFQLSKGDIIKEWFLNICKKEDCNNVDKHIIVETFKTKKEGLKRFNYFFNNPQEVKQ